MKSSRYFLAFFLTLYTFVAAGPEAPSIAIVGAGLAGLTAGYQLKSEGYEVELYEARNRPGGRVCTVRFKNGYEELGAKGLDDGHSLDEILELIKEFGLQISTSETAYSPLLLVDGKRTPSQVLFKEAPSPTDEKYAWLKQQSRKIHSLSDLMDLFLGKEGIIRELMENGVRGYEGSDTRQLSPEYLDFSFWRFYKGLYYDTPKVSVLHSIEGGNSKLVEALVLRLKDRIHYEHVLKRISYEPTDDTFCLHFTNGVLKKADILLLTLPCTTLREVEIEAGLFPEDQWFAIQTLQYGTNAKLLIPVKLPSDQLSTFGMMSNCYSWLNREQSVMTWYYGGKAGIFDDSSIASLRSILNQDICTLRLLYPGIEFPLGLEPMPVNPDPSYVYDRPIGISWINEPYSKGSYSNWAPGQCEFFNKTLDIGDETLRYVFRPILKRPYVDLEIEASTITGDERVFFAGEHTDVEDPCTMSGAVRSGKRAAHMIRAALIKNSEIPRQYQPCLE